jgi:hypothetical protein
LRSLPEICADQLRVHHRANHHGPQCKFRISWSSTSAKANFCGGNVLTVTHGNEGCSSSLGNHQSSAYAAPTPSQDPCSALCLSCLSRPSTF